MEISYKLEKFEGPLDLLLRLIEKNKIDIFDIPIEVITDQYLACVSEMENEDLDLLSDFLVMAATLLDIKARMLLPPEEEETEEEGDPREELVRRLLEYKMYKCLSEELRLYELEGEKTMVHPSAIPREVAKYEPPVDLDALLGGLTAAELRSVYQSIMRRRASMIDPLRSGFGTIRKEPVSLEETVISVMKFARKTRRFHFRQVIGEKKDKIYVVVAFLAVLELMKIGKISLRQDALFDDMEIETIEPDGEIGEMNLEGLDDFDGDA